MAAPTTITAWDVIPMPEYIESCQNGGEQFAWENGGLYMDFPAIGGAPCMPVDKLSEDPLGMSKDTLVWKVVPKSEHYKRPLALKLFTKATRNPQKTKEEVENMISLQHHHVVRYVAHYQSGSHFGILMYPPAKKDLDEYCQTLSTDLEGSWFNKEHREEELKRTMARRKRLLHWHGCSAQALSYLHSNTGKRCMKHKDVKPNNLLIDAADSILVADLGIAHVQDGPDDVTGGITAKTVRYASPETLLNEDGRKLSADIFSLGTVYVEMITLAFGIPLKQLHRYRNAITSSEKFHTDDDNAWKKPYAETVESLQTWLEQLKQVVWDLRFKNDSRWQHAIRAIDLIKRMVSKEAAQRPKACELWAVFRHLQEVECATCKLEEYELPLDQEPPRETLRPPLHQIRPSREHPIVARRRALPSKILVYDQSKEHLIINRLQFLEQKARKGSLRSVAVAICANSSPGFPPIPISFDYPWSGRIELLGLKPLSRYVHDRLGRTE
jgi:serine/threonine protein kinase